MDRLRLCVVGVLLVLGLIGCRPEEMAIEVTVMATAEPPPSIATAMAAGASVPTLETIIEEEGLAADVLTPEPTAVQNVSTRASYAGTPTPDPPHTSDTTESLIQHTVSSGETLSTIAQLYGLSLDELLEINELGVADVIFAGQVLNISSQALTIGPSVKLVPDSEILYGPSARGFDIQAFIASQNGYLLTYTEPVEGQFLSGSEIIEITAVRYSVNPRLLLAMLEYRTGWVTQAQPAVGGDYFMGRIGPGNEGLYNQLGWAANQVNLGYYGRAEGGVDAVFLSNGTRVGFHPEINHGTAGVQNWLAAHDTSSYDQWLKETNINGFFATYNRLFGNPFGFTVEPIWPEDLQQPELILPWEEGVAWYFTGGPHGGWAAGSGWAALDFAPDKDLRGCYVSEQWLTAAAAGTVVYSNMGGVIVDLDGDGYLGTGWTLVYWHVDQAERVPVGVQVASGDRLGHPSCEGGFSNGTHVHFARRYNGRWVAADGQIPFNLDGWVSAGAGREYDGFLRRDGVEKEACVCAEEINELVR